MNWTTYHTIDLKEKYLFKFISKQWLIKYLETGNIWFSRADQFGDKMECVTINDLIKTKPDYEAIEKRKLKYLISCWHLADKESLAFWDTYSELPLNRKNFAIRFEREKLLSLLRDNYFRNDRHYYKTKWIHGKVAYKDLIDITEKKLIASKMKFPAFRKETAFKYENEYRFVIELVQETNKEGMDYKLGDPQKIPFDILINPLLNKEEFANLNEEIVSLGYEDKIKPSILTKWFRPDKW